MKIQLAFGKNLRADAAWVLFNVLENGRSTRELLPDVLNRTQSDKDKKWLNETILGVLRTLPTLQYWLRPKLTKPLKGSKKVIEHLLLVGLYQLTHMRVSDHAAINETVSACVLFKAHGLKGLVNAILRDCQRTPPQLPNDAILQSGLPKWLYNTIADNYPDAVASIIENMNGNAPLWLRVNTTQISVDAYCDNLDQAGINYTRSSAFQNGLILRGVSVPSLPGFSQGHFAVQDGAAQYAAWLLDAQDEDTVLDCCAAPGGKTCHIYDLAPSATITALDSDQKRLLRVEENLTRLHCKAHIQVGDAGQPDTWWHGKQYDRILVDAPCSATGVIRRHPDIRWLRKASDIDVLVAMQAEILNAVWPLLKPGGTLVYSTCSILPQENTAQIEQFLARTGDASRSMDDKQILPGDEQMDGFYYARLVKSKSE